MAIGCMSRSFIDCKFLPRDAMLSAVYAVVVCLCVCVCLSVCQSITLRYCIKTAKCWMSKIMPHDSFLTPKLTAKFERDQPLRGRQIKVGWVKIRHFWCKPRCNSKTVQDRRIVSIKVEQSYVLYRIAMFPMTLGDSYPQTTSIFAFFVAFHIFIVSKRRAVSYTHLTLPTIYSV